jgi:hypothetical protein
MDVTANQSVMVGCDEAEVNEGHYTGDRKVGAFSHLCGLSLPVFEGRSLACIYTFRASVRDHQQPPARTIQHELLPLR